MQSVAGGAAGCERAKEGIEWAQMCRYKIRQAERARLSESRDVTRIGPSFQRREGGRARRTKEGRRDLHPSRDGNDRRLSSVPLTPSHSHSRNPRLKKAHHFGSEDLSNLTSLTNGGLNYTTVQRIARACRTPAKNVARPIQRLRFEWLCRHKWHTYSIWAH